MAKADEIRHHEAEVASKVGGEPLPEGAGGEEAVKADYRWPPIAGPAHEEGTLATRLFKQAKNPGGAHQRAHARQEGTAWHDLAHEAFLSEVVTEGPRPAEA